MAHNYNRKRGIPKFPDHQDKAGTISARGFGSRRTPLLMGSECYLYDIARSRVEKYLEHQSQHGPVKTIMKDGILQDSKQP